MEPAAVELAGSLHATRKTAALTADTVQNGRERRKDIIVNWQRGKNRGARSSAVLY
jgi:hypothetical protein